MAGDILDEMPIDACPECGTVLQTSGCRNCGWERPANLEAYREVKRMPYSKALRLSDDSGQPSK